MSAIAGVIHLDGCPADPDLIKVMTAALAHRGQDGMSHWTTGGVSLGHCMLHTTPSSLIERQPLANEDESVVLVMDGRLDNWEDLSRTLNDRGVRLENGCDAELVLRAYELWGRDCLEHVIGDFALVVWDARRREVFCARDRMGNKPLFYHYRKNMLVFASEERAILALPDFEAEFDRGRLAEFLIDEQYSIDRTIWKGVTRLVAGHFTVASASGFRIERYWSPSYRMTTPYRSIDELAEHYRSFIFDLTRRVGRSHKPVAFEVSGGLDSSALFLIADKLIRDDNASAPDILGYTLAVPDAPDSNDLDYARAAARQSGRPIREIAPTRLALNEYVSKARGERTFAGFPNGAMSHDLRRSARHDGAVSLISGLGGDEWLGSPFQNHPYYVEEIAGLELIPLLKSFTADAADFGLPTALEALARFGIWPFIPDGIKKQWRQHLKRGGRAETNWQQRVLNSELYTAFMENIPVEPRRTRPSCEFSRAIKSGLLTPPFHTWAWEREEADAASMGLELRAPFRSAEMVEFSLTIPARFMTRGKYDKFLHRMALQDCLPPEIARRTDKATFDAVFDWQLADAGEFFESVGRNRREWFGDLAPADLYKSYVGSGGSNGESSRDRLRWVLSAIIGCAGLAT